MSEDRDEHPLVAQASTPAAKHLMREHLRLMAEAETLDGAKKTALIREARGFIKSANEMDAKEAERQELAMLAKLEAREQARASLDAVAAEH